MRNSVRFAVLILLGLCPIASAAAQTSESVAGVLDQVAQVGRCSNNSGQQPGASSALCSGPTSGGSAFASSMSNNSARSASAVASLTQSGPDFSMAGFSQAFSNQTNSIFVTGTSNSDDNLVFRFLTTRAFEFLGTTGGSIYSSYLLTLVGATANAAAGGTDTPTGSTFFIPGGVTTPGGMDLSVPFSSFTGTYDYFFQLYVDTFRQADQPQGAYGSSNFDAHLAGIDAVNVDGDVIASAVFGANGDATLDLTTTPEPASVALFATGLLGIVGVARRKVPGAA